jgi:hypothetical protein
VFASLSIFLGIINVGGKENYFLDKHIQIKLSDYSNLHIATKISIARARIAHKQERERKNEKNG